MFQITKKLGQINSVLKATNWYYPIFDKTAKIQNILIKDESSCSQKNRKENCGKEKRASLSLSVHSVIRSIMKQNESNWQSCFSHKL